MAVIHSQNAFMDRVNIFCNRVTLSDEQFEALSQQAERELKDNRSIYMLKVVALALLGYAFIAMVVAVLIGAIIGLAQLLINAHVHNVGALGKLFILLLIPLWAIAKSLWVKVPEPTGIEVKRNEAPELFALLDELCAALHTRVDKVLVDEQFNAAVVQIPRLGMLGFYKNILMLGMPLMLTQRPLQMKAILAHELGHLSGNHSKSGAWVYTLRLRWAKLLDTIGEAGSLFFAIFLVFFSWFSPRFSAYTLALARLHELEADANAVKIAGWENFTKGMLCLHVYGKFLGKTFWPSIRELMKSTEKPPDGVYLRLKKEAASYSQDQDELQKTIRQALEEKGSGGDTHPPLLVRLAGADSHPTLNQRLASANKNEQLIRQPEVGAGQQTAHFLDSLDLPTAVVEDLSQPLPSENSAASVYLGPVMDSILRQLSLEWQNGLGPTWQQEYDRVAAAAEGLVTLQEKAAESELTIDELKLKAYLLSQTGDDKACTEVYKELLVLSPNQPGIRFNLGMMLLEDDFETGLSHVQEAIAARSTLLPQACPILLPMLREKGKIAEVTHLEGRLALFQKDAELAQKERMAVTGESILEPHGLPEDDLEYMRSVFVELPTIKEAYVVRKFVRYLPDCPYLVIGLEMKPNSGGNAGAEENLAIAQWLIGNLQLPYEFCVSTFDMHTNKLKKNIVAMDDSLVYRK